MYVATEGNVTFLYTCIIWLLKGMLPWNTDVFRNSSKVVELTFCLLHMPLSALATGLSLGRGVPGKVLKCCWDR